MALILSVLYIFIIGAVVASIAVLILRGKKEKYNIMCMGCQIMVILWCVSQIMILISETREELTFSYILGNAGVCFVSAFWFGFAVSYGGFKLPKGVCYFPFLISGVHYILILTNNIHHLYYTSFSKEEVLHGVFFYTNVAQTYLFVVAGAVILYCSIEGERKNVSCTSGDIRTETDTAKTLIITAVLVPMAFNAFYLTGLVNASFDITPLGFGISIILVLLATIRYRFMEVNIEAFDTVLSGLADGVAIFGKDGRCTFYNDAFRDYTGGECILQTENIRLYIVSMAHIDENVYMDGDGRYFQIQVYQNMEEVLFSDMEGNKPIVFVIKDISRYYELLSQTRELAVANQKLALERERNRIAQQVHDTAGHTLTMIQSYMKLAKISSGRQEADKVEQYLEGAEGLAHKGIRELRESINELRREAGSRLVTQGIMQLTAQVKEILAEVTIQGEDSEEYSHLSHVLYDCARETITNTLKYAHADKLDIVLRFKGDAVELVMADDGVGCEGFTDNNGLSGIRERVAGVGGTVRFSTAKNEGFLTCIRIPVYSREATSQA